MSSTVLNIYAPDVLTTSDIENAFGKTWTIHEDEPGQWRVECTGVLIDIGEDAEDFDIDLAHYVESRISGADRLRRCYGVAATQTCEGSSFDDAMDALITITQRAGGALISDDQLVWREASDAEGFVRPLVATVAMTWYARSATPIQAWIGAMERTLPEARPRVFGYPERSLDGDGIARAEAFRGTPSVTGSMYLRGNKRFGLITFSTPAPPDQKGSDGICRVSMEMIADEHTGPEGGQTLRSFFEEAALALDAESAFAHVPTDRVIVAGSVTATSPEDAFAVFSLKTGLLGLPSTPAWLTWLGPDYANLVASDLQRLADTWTVEYRNRAVMISGGVAPTRVQGLPSTWFSRRFCVRRRRIFTDIGLYKAARLRPDTH